ncbi:TPA: PerC family transcriptional regulator [Escherichia coli]|nr:PerC family transcriptional regulator [Escherichia coli]HCB9750194.1 PerC family transcriptional regulator [Escherichia coli]
MTRLKRWRIVASGGVLLNAGENCSDRQKVMKRGTILPNEGHNVRQKPPDQKQQSGGMYAPSGQQRPERLKIWGLTRKKKILYGARSTGVKQGEETEVNMDTITDKKAEQLESQGLWRRAAARWLDVMKEAHTDPQREHIARRREICLANFRML